MKKTSIFALALALTATLLTGCRSGNNGMGTATETTVLPSQENTQSTTAAPTQQTTHATNPQPTQTELPTGDTTETTHDGILDEALDDMTDGTGNTSGHNSDMTGRIRKGMPRMK